MNLKPHKAKVHLLKFLVNYFFSHFYQVCISKRFFHSRSGHFTFGSDCTVWFRQGRSIIQEQVQNTPVVHFSAFANLATDTPALLPLFQLVYKIFPFPSTLASIVEKIFRAMTCALAPQTYTTNWTSLLIASNIESRGLPKLSREGTVHGFMGRLWSREGAQIFMRLVLSKLFFS